MHAQNYLLGVLDWEALHQLLVVEEKTIRRQEAHYIQEGLMHTFRAIIVKVCKGLEDLVEMPVECLVEEGDGTFAVAQNVKLLGPLL